MSLSPLQYRTHLKITGETDPQLPARVLGIISTLNALPTEFHLTALGQDQCLIEMVLSGGDEQFLRRVATQVRKIPSVIETQGEIRATRL